jgi:hypothetical protein
MSEQNIYSSADAKALAIAGKLPSGSRVGGALYLQGTGITALPDGLTVGGWLDLRGTGITALPDNLTVGGWLYLQGTGITALPDNLTVGGLLHLQGTGITALLEDERGYRMDRAGDYYHAGCRRFTADEALAHWGSPDYPNPARGKRFCEAVIAEEKRRQEVAS